MSDEEYAGVASGLLAHLPIYCTPYAGWAKATDAMTAISRALRK